MAKEYKLTHDRLRELEAELTYLKTTREKEVAEFDELILISKCQT